MTGGLATIDDREKLTLVRNAYWDKAFHGRHWMVFFQAAGARVLALQALDQVRLRKVMYEHLLRLAAAPSGPWTGGGLNQFQDRPRAARLT